MFVPQDLPHRLALASIAELPLGRKARVLDVGCGEGRLLDLLKTAGFNARGVESSAKAVAAAQRKGLAVKRAAWPDFADGPYDAIVMCRFLHHAKALDQSVLRAHELLRPRGFLLVDDFAFAEATPELARWTHRILQMLMSNGVASPARDPFLTGILRARGRIGPWRHGQAKAFHHGAAMARAIQIAFGNLKAKTVPYAYRYLVRTLPPRKAFGALAEALFFLECEAGKKINGFLIGRQFVARKER